MLGRTDFWTGFGIITTLIVGGLGSIFTLMLYFQNDVADRFNRMDQHQLEQTEKLGEINGTVRYVQALDEHRVGQVLTAMGHDPSAHDFQRTQVYLTSAGASDGDLMDISLANASDLPPMIRTYRVGSQELRCVRLRELENRSAILCSPQPTQTADASHNTVAPN